MIIRYAILSKGKTNLMCDKDKLVVDIWLEKKPTDINRVYSERADKEWEKLVKRYIVAPDFIDQYIELAKESLNKETISKEQLKEGIKIDPYRIKIVEYMGINDSMYAKQYIETYEYAILIPKSK